MFSVRGRVASLNVTRALRWPLPENAAGTCTRNGELNRCASRLPSSVNTTRLILRPTTVAVNPSLHGVFKLGVECLSLDDPFRVGTVEWLAGGCVPLPPGPVEPVGGVEPVAGGVEPVGGVEPGGVDPAGGVVEVPHIEASIVLWISVTAPS